MWTEERVEFLKKDWSAGLSCSQIAGRLGGVTRNAVIGKVFRLGLEKRADPRLRLTQRSAKKIQAKREPERKPKYFHVRSDKRPFAPAVSGEPLPPEPKRPARLFKLANMEDHQCRFPYGDPRSADFGFCGCKKMTGSSYCPGHHGKVYAGVPVRERSKDLPVWRGKHRLDKHGSKYAGKEVAV
jgi:GcrA cell cycle regulator